MKKTRCPKTAEKNGHGDEPPDPPDGLSEKQAPALEALAAGQSTAQAATAAAVSDRTVRRWLRDPPFVAALLELRREPVTQAVAIAQRYAPNAIGALLQLLQQKSAPASAIVSAATTVVKFAIDGVQMGELVQRIEALERSHVAPAAVNRRLPKPQHNGDAGAPEEAGP